MLLFARNTGSIPPPTAVLTTLLPPKLAAILWRKCLNRKYLEGTAAMMKAVAIVVTKKLAEATSLHRGADVQYKTFVTTSTMAVLLHP